MPAGVVPLAALASIASLFFELCHSATQISCADGKSASVELADTAPHEKTMGEMAGAAAFNSFDPDVMAVVPFVDEPGPRILHRDRASVAEDARTSQPCLARGLMTKAIGVGTQTGTVMQCSVKIRQSRKA